MADPPHRSGGSTGPPRTPSSPGTRGVGARPDPRSDPRPDPRPDPRATTGSMSAADVRRRLLRDTKAIDEGLLDLVYDSLADEDAGVRREAIRLIARSAPTPGLLLTLEKALTDEAELARRSAAMEALAAMGKPALVLLGRLAGDPRAGVRRLAVDALGLSRMPEAVDVLERCARDPQPAVRSAALEAVARTGAARAPAILLRAVDDKSEQPAVVLAALLGLLQLGKTPPAHVLRRLVDDALTAPPALRLLGRAGEAAFLVDAIVQMTASRQRAAVLGLAEALDPQGPAPVRPPARLKSPEVITALRALVESADVMVACAALVVAAHAGDVQAVVHAAARDDRAHMASAAHRAVAVLEPQQQNLPETLRMLVADDAPGADLVLELAEAAERLRARAQVTSKGPAKLEDRSFARLARLVEQSAGIGLNDDARVRLEARLMPRVDETGSRDFAAYVDLLASPAGKEELKRALDLIAVHETYFFRERAQLDAFRDEVVPALVELGKARPTEPVRVWSAGTSTGEESYTLAILLEESALDRFEIVGTDLSPTSLETARIGRYTPRSFRGEIDTRFRRKWFIYELGGVHVHPDLKKRTRFDLVNLVDEAAVNALPTFDVILCRNVLIYMSPAARARVIDSFWRKLRPGGLLLLGHSESLLHVETPFKLRPLQRALAYEKPDTP